MTTDVAAPPQQQTEAELRIDLAAAYRAVALFGWDDLIYTHISVRIPGTDHHFLINPAGFVIHSAIHAAREDAQCVLHVHYAPGVAVSIQPDGLQMISQHASLMYGLIGYHDYEGIALRDEEKPRLVNDLRCVLRQDVSGLQVRRGDRNENLIHTEICLIQARRTRPLCQRCGFRGR